MRYLIRRILNGIALGYKFSDIPEFLLVMSGLQYFFRKKIFNRETIKEISIKGHVVSLRFRFDRRIQIMRYPKEAQIPYSFYDAAHGRQIKVKQLKSFQFSDQSIKYLSKGSIGAIISHYQLWIAL